MDALFEFAGGFIVNSVELRGLGWNTGTIGWIGASLITVVQAWGTLMQGQTIFRGRSAKGVSILFNTFLFFEFPAFLIYGYHAQSVNMIWNALAIIPGVAVVFLGVARYGNWERLHFLSLPFFAALPVLMWNSDAAGRETLLLFCIGVIVVGMGAQFKKFLAAPTIGAFDIRFTYTFLLAAMFWAIFALAIENWTIFIANIIAAGILTATVREHWRKLALLA